MRGRSTLPAPAQPQSGPLTAPDRTTRQHVRRSTTERWTAPCSCATGAHRSLLHLQGRRHHRFLRLREGPRRLASVLVVARACHPCRPRHRQRRRQRRIRTQLATGSTTARFPLTTATHRSALKRAVTRSSGTALHAFGVSAIPRRACTQTALHPLLALRRPQHLCTTLWNGGTLAARQTGISHRSPSSLRTGTSLWLATARAFQSTEASRTLTVCANDLVLSSSIFPFEFSDLLQHGHGFYNDASFCMQGLATHSACRPPWPHLAGVSAPKRQPTIGVRSGTAVQAARPSSRRFTHQTGIILSV